MLVFLILHIGKLSDVKIPFDDFRNMLKKIGESKALVINVVDLFDFHGVCCVLIIVSFIYLYLL